MQKEIHMAENSMAAFSAKYVSMIVTVGQSLQLQ